ncbi:hypothetical protein RFI_27766 [Reticulomyxa filosa]|uniref:CBS domain-containing protein n=1 Tax=Reticulomyxa filosa TaxID=46433 RepID=X6M823_RETFI|nr:hypothetical protein RFI_27766 [Reticulomyxa filosa]|eukprot:ETO09612.1 hypothetical protein RFI_27766 [Reticulomyxa filosa]
MDETYRTSVNIPLSDLNLKFDPVAPTLTINDTLLQAVRILSKDKTVSAIPITNPLTGEVQDAFIRSDIRVSFFVCPFWTYISDINMKLRTRVFFFEMYCLDQFFVIDRVYMQLDTKISDFLARHKNSRHVPHTTLNANVFDVVFNMLSKRQHLSFVLTPQKKFVGIFTLRHVFNLLLTGHA